MSFQSEWTILEKLLLTQAVYKYGENMWFQVARILKQNDLLQQQGIQRSSDFYNQKNCSHQYYLLIEHLEGEKQASFNELLSDMPVVVRLARFLYSERVSEIKSKINKQQQEFNQLASEISSIKSGNWDNQLKAGSSITEEEEEEDADKKEKHIKNNNYIRTADDITSKSSKRQRLDSPTDNQEYQVNATAISDKSKD